MSKDDIAAVTRAEKFAERKIEKAEKKMHEMLAETEQQIMKENKEVLSNYRKELAKEAEVNENAARNEAERIREESIEQSAKIRQQVRWNTSKAIQYIIDEVIETD